MGEEDGWDWVSVLVVSGHCFGWVGLGWGREGGEEVGCDVEYMV